MESKSCSKCKEIKQVEEFTKDKYSKSGYKSWCKKCHRTFNKLDREYANAAQEKFRNSIKGISSTLLYSSLRRSINKNLEFNLDISWVYERVEKNVCEISGLPFEKNKNRKSLNNPFAPSIDRIDPNKGYTKDNCRLICFIINQAKSDYDDETLFKMCKAVTEFNQRWVVVNNTNSISLTNLI